MGYNNSKRVEAVHADMLRGLSNLHGARLVKDHLDEEKRTYESTWQLPYGLTSVKVELSERALGVLKKQARRAHCDKQFLLRRMAFVKLNSSLLP